MGIKIEFNPDLALRNVSEFKAGRRKLEECIPEKLETGKTYDFLKSGQRNYWLDGELPLLETKGGEKLSVPLASIRILEVTHFREDNKNYTRGKYQITEIFIDGKIHFNSYAKIKD